MTRVHIIANPVAGGGRGAVQAEALVRALDSKGIEATLFLTEKAGDGRLEATRAEADVVAVVGGDGTLNEVLNGLPDAPSCAVAILPVGTANVVARQLGMKSEADFVAEAIAAGNVVAMDVGLHSGQRFLLGAGAGLDAAVAHAVHAGRGHKSNLLKWVYPAVRTALLYDYPNIRVTIDGECVADDGGYVIVGNCRNSAGIFPATPLADISDSKLDVCVMRQITWYRLLWLVVRVWSPDFIAMPWITYRQGRCIELESADGDTTVLMQIDGDPAGELPATFTLVEWPLQMVCPESDPATSGSL
jgi:diacylglycerol kinase (ATP)